MPLPAVVVNPSKLEDVDAARAAITEVCTEHGWSEPLWIETTEEDPGVGQARQAVEAGADVVMVCGGDGTVRSAAQVLAGSGVTMGLLPAGTGNLLARNMDMTLDDLSGAARVALTGDDRPIDVGWMKVDSGEEQVFLVMAGMGFDAEIMANAPEALKAKVGSGGLRRRGSAALQRPAHQGDDHRRRRRAGGPPHPHRRDRQLRQAARGPGADAGRRDRRRAARHDLDRAFRESSAGRPSPGSVMTRQRKGHHRVERWQGRGSPCRP